LKKNLSEVVSKKFDLSNLKVLRTSGSTGRPLHVYITEAENEFRKAKHLRAQIACGQKPWDKWVTITSPLHFAETTRLQRLLRFYSVTPVSVFEGVATQIAKIEKLKPDVLDGYSNSLLLLAKEVHRRGLSTIRPRFLVSGAELMDGHSRKFIEERFEAPLYDQYASVEFERMAWQCSERNEYHIDADSVVMQFVDDNCEEVAPGEEGEIVCTSLFNYAMPFLRYALDDVGVPSEESDCPCGVTFPLMKVIEGRKNSLLALPEGRVLAPLAFILAIWIFKYYSCIDLFRIKQKRTDLLIFKLKVKDCSVDKRTIERELISHLRRVLEISEDEVTFEVEFVDDIPLDMNGKFKIVVSELDQKQE
jgi:phenylacetate-CoA ligase